MLRCVKKVGLVIVGGCIPRRDTGAQRRVRRPRDSLTPGRADPRQAGRAHTQEETQKETESCCERKKGTVNFSGFLFLFVCTLSNMLNENLKKKIFNFTLCSVHGCVCRGSRSQRFSTQQCVKLFFLLLFYSQYQTEIANETHFLDVNWLFRVIFI